MHDIRSTTGKWVAGFTGFYALLTIIAYAWLLNFLRNISVSLLWCHDHERVSYPARVQKRSIFEIRVSILRVVSIVIIFIDCFCRLKIQTLAIKKYKNFQYKEGIKQ